MDNFLANLENLERNGHYEQVDALMCKLAQAAGNRPDNFWDYIGRLGGKFVKYVHNISPSLAKWLSAKTSAQDEIERGKGMMDPMKNKIMDPWEGGSPVDRTMSYQMDDKGVAMMGGQKEMSVLPNLYETSPKAGKMEQIFKGFLNGYFQSLERGGMEEGLATIPFGGASGTSVGDVLGR